MVPFILAAREQHLVASPHAYRAKHCAFLEEKAANGARFQVHASPAPVTARINHGAWVTDCECGASNATDPREGWRTALCFGCGAVHDMVTFPDDWEAIESALVGRPSPSTRNWLPGETVADLQAETDARLAAMGGPAV